MPQNVRKLAAPAADRRVLRTQRALVQSLVELVLEKSYRRITIQDLLDRADVGRSTFYAHYRGKDDLLLRSFEHMLEQMLQALERSPAPARVAPVAELFRHVGGQRRFHAALVRAQQVDRLFHAGTEVVGRALERRHGLPPAAARALAGALFAQLRWWLDHGGGTTPEQMDALYDRLIRPALLEWNASAPRRD